MHNLIPRPYKMTSQRSAIHDQHQQFRSLQRPPQNQRPLLAHRRDFQVSHYQVESKYFTYRLYKQYLKQLNKKVLEDMCF